MPSVDLIKKDLVAAMKSGDTLSVSVLRMLVSGFGYKQIDVQHDLTDEEIMSVIASEAKKRREAVESFEKAGRSEQVEKEKQELEILRAYLPKMLTEEEIRNEILEIREIAGMKDFGQVMKIVAPMFKGKADGSLVAKIVNAQINQS